MVLFFERGFHQLSVSIRHPRVDDLSKRLAFLLRVVFLHPELELTISEVTGHVGPNCCHRDVTGHFFVSTP